MIMLWLILTESMMKEADWSVNEMFSDEPAIDVVRERMNSREWEGFFFETLRIVFVVRESKPFENPFYTVYDEWWEKPPFHIRARREISQ